MPHEAGHTAENPTAKKKGRLRAGLGNKNAADILAQAKASLQKVGGAVKSGAGKVGGAVKGAASKLAGAFGAGGETTTRAKQARGRPSGGPTSGGAPKVDPFTGEPNQSAQPKPKPGGLRQPPSKLAKLTRGAGQVAKKGLGLARGAALPLALGSTVHTALTKGTTTEGRDELTRKGGVDPRDAEAENVTLARQRQRVQDAAAGDDFGSFAGISGVSQDTPVVNPKAFRAAAATFEGGARDAFFIPGREGDFGAPTAPQPQGQGLRQPQFGSEGERSFSNEDIGLGAANRGTASVETNQAVAQRLSDKGAAERAAGLRAAQPAAQGGAAQGGAAASRLAGGGIASAFGSLALSGNQLRREAADRTRSAADATSANKVQQKADLDLRNTLTEIGAQSAADSEGKFQDNITKLATGRSKAGESDDPQALANYDNAIVESALNNPNGNAAAFANTLLAKALVDLGPQSRFAAFFNPAFLGGEGRTTGDALEGLFRGDFNTADLANAFEKVQIDDTGGTFRMVVARQEGGGFEDIGDINDLPEPVRRLALQLLKRQSTGQRGDQDRANPNVATQTPRGLRQ